MNIISRYLKRPPLSLIALFALVLPSFAYAHVIAGATSSWAHGFGHPLLGADHVVAMISVGLWAMQMGGRAIWLIPLTFISVMAIGGQMGMASVPMVYAEQGIVLSLLVLGVLISATIRLPLLLSATLVGVFALCHGYSHGIEIPHGSSNIAYVSGFMLSTALLHTTGIGIALFARDGSREKWLRLSGIAITLFGGSILLAG